MKFRFGFISNSSSASFIIYNEFLKEDEREKIIDYLNNNNEDGWDWHYGDEVITGFTIMDNDSFVNFLTKLNVGMKAVRIYSTQ